MLAGVRCMWLRHDLETMKKRLKALEAKSAQEGLVLTEAQVVALERAKADKEAHGEFESEHPGYCGAKGHVLRRHAQGRRADRPADLHRHLHEGGLRQALRPQDADHGGRSHQRPGAAVLRQHEVKLLRMLIDRGSEYCGNPERHEYELYLAVEDIDHSRTRTRSPQTNGVCERFHTTALNEFYRVAFRKKVYRSLDELQADLDAWLAEYNEPRPHHRAAGASARPRCRPSSTPCLSRRTR